MKNDDIDIYLGFTKIRKQFDNSTKTKIIEKKKGKKSPYKRKSINFNKYMEDNN